VTARRFWPVIHTVSYEQAVRNMAVAEAAGAHGVFLINMEVRPADLVAIVERLPAFDLAVGVNLLGLGNRAAAHVAEDIGAVAYWTDSADPSQHRGTGDIEWFGGTAHKGNRYVPTADLPLTFTEAATRMQVPTITGPGTGQEADVERVRLARRGLPGAHPAQRAHRLGLASGLTPDNVTRYLPYVTDYLAATGISSSFHGLDPVLTGRLADQIGGAL
jgi:predicted TIM-barrel enzyme